MKNLWFYLARHNRLILSVLPLSIIIASVALIPHVYIPHLPINDKIQHIITFAAFTILITFKRKWQFTCLCLFILALSGMMEIIQPYFNRSMELADFVANCIGVLIVFIPVFLFKCIFEKKKYKYVLTIRK